MVKHVERVVWLHEIHAYFTYHVQVRMTVATRVQYGLEGTTIEGTKNWWRYWVLKRNFVFVASENYILDNNCNGYLGWFR